MEVATKVAVNESETSDQKLESVSHARICVHNLQLASVLDEDETGSKRTSYKQRSKRTKPPMSSQASSQQAG